MSLLDDEIRKLQCMQQVCGSEIFVSESMDVEMQIAEAPHSDVINAEDHMKLSPETMTTIKPLHSMLVAIHCDNQSKAYISMRDKAGSNHTYLLKECAGVSFKNTILYAFLYQNVRNEVRIGIFDTQLTENDLQICSESPLERHMAIHDLLASCPDKSKIFQAHWAGYKLACQAITSDSHWGDGCIDFKSESLVFLPQTTKQQAKYDIFPWKFSGVE